VSIQAIAWVLEHSESELADRLVLLAVANHADAQGRNAWPSAEQIAKEARVHRATVFRSLTRLVEMGELVATARRLGKPSIYQLPMGSQDATGQGSQRATGRGSQDATKGVAGCDSTRRTSATQTVLNRPEPSRVRAREAPAEHLALAEPLTEQERERGKDAVARLRQGFNR
jgi:hypothetical protein